MSIFLKNKPLPCDPKVELGHVKSGVHDFPCGDTSIVPSRIS